jgi:penicillin-binding protein 1A
MRFFRTSLATARRALAGKPRAISAAIALMALMIAVAAGATVWFGYDLTSDLPTAKQLRGLGDMAQATTIYDAHDAPVFIIYKEQRIEVPLERISPNMVKAVLSVEDQRFYEHAGVDVIRVVAAGIRNLEEGRRAEGGSTITQQLARQSFLTRDKTLRRKFKEVILAAQIEHEFSKKEILELYLNKVYFGDGLYGIEAASLGYFGVHAGDLSIDQAALLAGLIQSPSAYAPTVNPERALARRTIVLQLMEESGAIDHAAFTRAKNTPLRLTNRIEMKDGVGLYFKEQVRRELVERFGGPRVAEGGLRVYTTLDAALQRVAEKAVEDGASAIERRRGYSHARRHDDGRDDDDLDYLQGALVAIDPSTGEVRAMVGGRDFNDSRFNRAMQARRQPGSAFKPFVYAAALESGYSPASVIDNLNNPILTAQGDWVPEDEHSNATSMTIRSALRMSSNRAAVQMLDTIGIPKAVSFAQRLNIGTPASVPSLALGASEVTLMSLTAAYGAFAAKGVVRQPILIRRVADSDGKMLYQAQGRSQQAVTPETAFLMSSMLADVVNAGTAVKARQAGFTLPAAGKTGTTNDYMDAWFVGYTPHLVTGVWLGFDQPQTIVARGYAADLAVPVWASFMKAATNGDPPDWFDKPDSIIGVNVCRLSGKLPNLGCGNAQTMDADGNIETRSMIYTDYFVKGRQPTTLCPLHPGGDYATAIAGMQGTSPAPRPQSTGGTTSVPVPQPIPTPAVTGGVTQPSQPPPPEPQKKKGFWHRIFGGGRGGDGRGGGG